MFLSSFSVVQASTTGGLSAALENAVSYAAPTVTGLAGCAMSANVSSTLVECDRNGDNIVTIYGFNFGPPGARVLVGGQLCTQVGSSLETAITCRLKSGTTVTNQIIVVQATGRMFSPETFRFSISYHQCPAGRFSQGLNCTICPVLTYSPSVGLGSCLPCPVGSTIGIQGATACTACAAGKFGLPGAATGLAGGTCAACGPGTFTAVNGSVACASCAPGTYTALNESRSCVDCTAGSQSNDFVSCQLCRPGTFGSAVRATACTVCAIGTYSNTSGVLACATCPAGSFVDHVSTACLVCAPGMYSPAPQSTCFACAQGSFAPTTGASFCHACPVGTTCPSNSMNQSLACQAGTFTNLASQTTCMLCTGDLFNPFTGATACLRCPAFSVPMPGNVGCSCNAGYFATSTVANESRCLSCPVGATCSTPYTRANTRTLAAIVSLPGYWKYMAVANPTEVDPPQFFACPFPQACPSSANGTCTEGYGGVMCAVCAPGYHNSGQACIPCVGATSYLLPIMIAAFAAALAVFWWVSQRYDITNFLNIVKIMISYLQVIGSSSASYNIPWPGMIQTLMDYYRLALLDLFQVTATDCVASYDFYLPYASWSRFSLLKCAGIDRQHVHVIWCVSDIGLPRAPPAPSCWFPPWCTSSCPCSRVWWSLARPITTECGLGAPWW